MFPKHRELAWSLSRHTTTYPDAQTLRWTLPSFYIPAFRYGPSRDVPCAPSRSLVLPLQADLFPIVPTGVAGYCRVQACGHSRVWPLFVFLFISLLLILIPHRDDPVQLALSLIVSPLASGGPQFVLFGPPPPGMLYIRRSRYVFDFGPPPPARLSRSLAGLPLQNFRRGDKRVTSLTTSPSSPGSPSQLQAYVSELPSGWNPGKNLG